MSLPSVFNRYRSELERELGTAISTEAFPLHAMMRYHLGWEDEHGEPCQVHGGKHLRSVLCLAACEATGGDWHSALPAAAALELVHNFTLIHDDIQDNSVQRRHRPTVWSIWGIAHGINAGDGMWAAAQLELLRLQQHGVSSQKVVTASHALGETCLKLCEGQYLDMSFENSLDIDIDNYLSMIDRKTAQLFSCSLFLGALTGTDNQDLISKFACFGREIGMAFQIHDDVLGIWGDEENTGKSTYTDIRERKKTLPIVYTLQNAHGADKEKLVSLYSHAEVSTDDANQVLRVLDTVGAKKFTEEYRSRYCTQALKTLENMDISQHSMYQLRDVVTYMLQ
ncbi:MAG: polyprenyl synthetase family protein [Chloroflexota bacterium]|nr:polyprenyl synthetase family protein [Chloroflexota bacterium]